MIVSLFCSLLACSDAERTDTSDGMGADSGQLPLSTSQRDGVPKGDSPSRSSPERQTDSGDKPIPPDEPSSEDEQPGDSSANSPQNADAHTGAFAAASPDELGAPNEPGATVKDGEKISSPGKYRGYSEAIYSGYRITSQYVAVRDGTKLAIDIYRPLDKAGNIVEAPLPVVWMHTPYSRASPIEADGLSMGELYPGQAASLIQYGYVVAIADFRGLYASYGRNIGYNRGEWFEAPRMDAYDITEWLAKQSWSTGQIGMWGCSATGGSQLQAATTAPPSLKAVFPMSCEFDAYPFGVPGGMAPAEGPTRAPPSTTDQFTRDLLAKPVDSDIFGTELNEAMASHGEALDNLGYMPFRDSLAMDLSIPWWTVSSPHTYLKELNESGTAFYVAANWDETYTKYGAFFTFSNLQRPVKLLMGPAGHCAWSAIPLQDESKPTVIGATGFDIRVEEHRYFDYWLKGIDNGLMAEPPVYYYTYGAPAGQEWSAATSWPPPNSTRVSYFLSNGQLLTAAPSEAVAKDDFVVSYDATALNAAEHGLVYETTVLEEAIQVTGHPVIDLWLASTAEDSDVVAYVQNVAPDGTTTSYSMNGRIRASLRKEEPAPYNNLDLPWHPSRKQDVELLVPGQPVELRFDVLPFSMFFDKGHKLRLILTFADTATPKITPAPVVSIYRDAMHPSNIELPILERNAAP